MILRTNVFYRSMPRRECGDLLLELLWPLKALICYLQPQHSPANTLSKLFGDPARHLHAVTQHDIRQEPARTDGFRPGQRNEGVGPCNSQLCRWRHDALVDGR